MSYIITQLLRRKKERLLHVSVEDKIVEAETVGKETTEKNIDINDKQDLN